MLHRILYRAIEEDDLPDSIETVLSSLQSNGEIILYTTVQSKIEVRKKLTSKLMMIESWNSEIKQYQGFVR